MGIFETGPDGVRRFVNQRWMEIAGLTAEEAAGTDWSRIVHPDDRERVTREWAVAVADGEVTRVDIAAWPCAERAGPSSAGTAA